MFNNCSKMTTVIAFIAGYVCLSDGKIIKQCKRSTTTTTGNRDFLVQKRKGRKNLKNFQ